MSYLDMSEEEIHDHIQKSGVHEMMETIVSLHEEAVEELGKTEATYNAVIDYILGKGYMESPLEFLRCWNEGDFEALREEWPDAPEQIYLADPLGSHPLYKGKM